MKKTKADYPLLWQSGKIQAQIRALANYQCERCGMEFVVGTNKAKTAQQKNGRPIIGTVHHIDGNIQDCSWRNCVFLCQACHCHVERKWRPGKPIPREWTREEYNWIIIRGYRVTLPRQLPLEGV